MYDYTLLFRLHIQKSQYRLSYLHCYFRFCTKELDILSYSLILLSIFIRNRYSKNTHKKNYCDWNIFCTHENEERDGTN